MVELPECLPGRTVELLVDLHTGVWSCRWIYMQVCGAAGGSTCRGVELPVVRHDKSEDRQKDIGRKKRNSLCVRV